MIRAAMTESENAPQNYSMSDGGQHTVVTTLHTPQEEQRDASLPSHAPHDMDTVGAVATAFLTNLSGGAACYDVDMRLVSPLTAEVADAFAAIRRVMAFADSADWRVASVSESSAVVVAFATDGSGASSSTERQEFTLHVDLAASCPITKIDVHGRSRFP